VSIGHGRRIASGDEDGRAVVALFIPAGWFHWLLGEGDWHVIFGGSFFPCLR
jgi:hypothetical protein